jgi:hypothetical protein
VNRGHRYKGTPQCQKSSSLAGIDDEEALANAPQPVDPTPVQPMDPVYAFLKTKPFNREIEWSACTLSPSLTSILTLTLPHAF